MLLKETRADKQSTAKMGYCKTYGYYEKHEVVLSSQIRLVATQLATFLFKAHPNIHAERLMICGL